MNNFQINSLIFLSVLTLLASSTSLSAQNTDQIMVKVDSAGNTYNSSIRTFKLSTCRYALSSGRMRCTSNPRIVSVETVQKDYQVKENLEDTKTFQVVISPASDKGSCMLVYDKALEEDNDTWMYLPALGKVKRIASSSDGRETGSVFGSEFSIEDVSDRKLKDYTYTYIGEDTFNNRPVWIIESIPTEKRAKKTYYSKIVSWVDKERFIILKEDLYNRVGKHYKQFVARKFENIKGVWLVTKSSMNNLTTHKITNYDIESVRFDMEVEDEFFTQRTMTDFAYREKTMEGYRAMLME